MPKQTYTLEQIEEVCSKATPGPWEVKDMDDCFIEPRICMIPGNGCYDYKKRESNADFIALARTALPELCARVRELEGEVDPYWMNKAQELEAENKHILQLATGDIHFDEDSLNIKLGGVGALFFMNFMIDLFKTNGGENFLTFGIADKDHKYSITIQNCDGKDSPAKMLERLQAENAALRKVAEAAQDVINELGSSGFEKLDDALSAARYTEQSEGGK